MQTQAKTRQEVRRVLLVTLVLNLTVAASKIIIGLATGAISITADGFHSLMDGTSNLIGLFAHRIAGQPPDESHPYGHQRFETLGALAIGILLLLTMFEIVSGALERLSSGERPEVTPLAIAVLIGTLAVNLFVSRYERRVGERLKSELLIADAANTGADVFVTLSVLFSMVLVSLGFNWADPVAALLVVVLIGRAAWQIVRNTGGILVDTAPFTTTQLVAIVEQVPSVGRVLRARSRGSVDAALVDIDVEVAPEMTADHTAAIATAVREKLEQSFDGIREVDVHFTPALSAKPDYVLTARAAADALGLATHEVRLADAPEGKILEMHVEVPSDQTLGEAHEVVSQLEQQVRSSLPDVAEVVTHIEPAQPAPDEPFNEMLPTECSEVEDDVLVLLKQREPAMDWHDVRASSYETGYAVTLHVTLPAQLPLLQAHQVAEDAELLVRTEIPYVERVTIHTEPPEKR